MEQAESKDLELVAIRDINDTDQGLYNIGGSLGELVIGLLSLDDHHKKEKSEVEVNYE